MTAIIGLVSKGKVYLGGDSAVGIGDEEWVSRDEKVWSHGEFVVGVAGTARSCDVFRYGLTMPTVHGDSELVVRVELPRAVRKAFADSGIEGDAADCLALIGLRGKLYLVDSQGAIIRPAHPFAAIGSGGPTALGAMHVTKGLDPMPRVRAALEACAAYCSGVRGPFHIVVTP